MSVAMTRSSPIRSGRVCSGNNLSTKVPYPQRRLHLRISPQRQRCYSATMKNPPPLQDEAPNLGACLRQLRFRRRMSIAEVSAATGIAKSTLSRVEHDQLSLTYAKLLQLCKGLRIDIAELF